MVTDKVETIDADQYPALGVGLGDKEAEVIRVQDRALALRVGVHLVGDGVAVEVEQEDMQVHHDVTTEDQDQLALEGAGVVAYALVQEGIILGLVRDLHLEEEQHVLQDEGHRAIQEEGVDTGLLVEVVGVEVVARTVVRGARVLTLLVLDLPCLGVTEVVVVPVVAVAVDHDPTAAQDLGIGVAPIRAQGLIPDPVLDLCLAHDPGHFLLGLAGVAVAAHHQRDAATAGTVGEVIKSRMILETAAQGAGPKVILPLVFNRWRIA
ncbi:hypothetical protein FRC20_009785 [Serendipita sp. 405]|nr:hypothetical protein FRC20_009785 [Serendipita sp. 405]